MNPDTLNQLWEQQPISSPISSEQLEKYLQNRSSRHLQRYFQKHQRRILFFLIGCVLTVLLLGLASNGFREIGAQTALTKLLAFQLGVGLMYISLTRDQSLDVSSGPLLATLRSAQRRIRLSLGLEIVAFLLLFPAANLVVAFQEGGLPTWTNVTQILADLLLPMSLSLLVVLLLISWYRPHLFHLKEAIREVEALQN